MCPNLCSHDSVSILVPRKIVSIFIMLKWTQLWPTCSLPASAEPWWAPSECGMRVSLHFPRLTPYVRCRRLPNASKMVSPASWRRTGQSYDRLPMLGSETVLPAQAAVFHWMQTFHPSLLLLLFFFCFWKLEICLSVLNLAWPICKWQQNYTINKKFNGPNLNVKS